jgi:ABC-type oligopeptide transport system ATPase subunit
MQFGKFVEVGEAEQVIFNPQHAYSRELLANMLPVGNE